jgi:hypothetical protein
LYQNVPLSLALSPRIYSEVRKFKPDIIHATSPGIMVSIKNPTGICCPCLLGMAPWFLTTTYHDSRSSALLPSRRWFQSQWWCLITHIFRREFHFQFLVSVGLGLLIDLHCWIGFVLWLSGTYQDII